MAFYNQESGVVSYDMELIETQPEIEGVKSKELANKFITYFNSVLEDIIKENLFDKFEEWCDESEEMNSPIICETCTRDFTDECDDRSSFDEIGKVICMECFAKEDDRDGICEGCNENAGEECSNCDNIACSECIEEFTTDEEDKRCRICADDEPDTEDEEEEEEEEEEKEYEFYDYGFSKVYKVVIMVAGGGMGNGNAYATVEGEWACEDDFNNGEDGEIYYCEYGSYPKKDYRGNRLIFSDEGTGFNIE